uniref:Protein krueppel n=1 Tax=Anopheles atroparvus TaxID=41427 RepID=A0AAG5DC24_ANOAO
MASPKDRIKDDRVQSSSGKWESLLEMADDEAVTSNSFCRICLLKQPNLTPLMKRIDGVMIPEMLYKVCGRQIEVQDSYPKSVCERCLCLLDSAFCFLNIFHQQDELLRSFYWDGSIVERLAKYQYEEETIIEKRLEALLERNGRMFATPHGAVRTTATMTDHATVASVGVNTELQKKPVESTATMKAEPCDEDLLDLIEIENEEGYFAYNSEAGETDSEEQMVEMKIDVLNSDEEDERIQSDSETMPEHDDTLDIIDPFRCYICDYMLENHEQLDEHLESHTLMLPFECKECIAEGATVRSCKTVSSLHNHFRSHLYPHRCETCGKRFLRKSLLATHRESHKDEVYNCDECGRQFSHRKTWHNHVVRHMAMRTGQFKCNVCDKVFGSKSRLVRHLQVHTGERPYGCRYCSKRFTDRHQLQCHTEKHVRDKECYCEVCGDKFPDHRKLEEHKIAKHLRGADLEEFLAKQKQRKAVRRANVLRDDRCPYPDCDYRAKTYGAMYVHKRSKHLNMHQCEICNKTFAFMNQLNTHMKLHTGEKPYECQVCGRKFRRSFSYREHMEMHKSDISYACTFCQKSFKRPRYLQAHMLTHTSTRTFSCEICGNCYKTKGELKKHSRQKHDMDIKQEVTEIVTEGESASEVFVVEYV